MGYALSIRTDLQFITEECCVCHVIFAMTQAHYDRLQEKKEQQQFYCPNGHAQWYLGKTEAQKLREQLDAQKRETEQQRSLRVAAERRTSAQIAINTKLKKRVHAGVCPHCQRTFSQLARHMKSKHSEQAPA